MTVIRSALFAGLALGATACQQRDRSAVPPAAQTAPPQAETAREPVPVYQPSVEPAPGTAAPYGAGALGGVAIATQQPGALVIEVSSAAPSTTRDRQGRSITARRRSMTNPSPSATRPPAELTTRPTDDPTDTSTHSTRANPDSQDQGIGGGDTYDRNR